jgi:hypothetical protein
MNIVEITQATPLTKKNTFLVCNSSAPIAVTLTSATGSGGGHYIKNIGAGAVTVTAKNQDLIDGAGTYVLAQYVSIFIMDYASEVWIVVSNNTVT